MQSGGRFSAGRQWADEALSALAADCGDSGVAGVCGVVGEFAEPDVFAESDVFADLEVSGEPDVLAEPDVFAEPDVLAELLSSLGGDVSTVSLDGVSAPFNTGTAMAVPTPVPSAARAPTAIHFLRCAFMILSPWVWLVNGYMTSMFAGDEVTGRGALEGSHDQGAPPRPAIARRAPPAGRSPPSSPPLGRGTGRSQGRA